LFLANGAALLVYILGGISLRWTATTLAVAAVVVGTVVVRRMPPQRRRRFARRVGAGATAGFVATVAYDVVRYGLVEIAGRLRRPVRDHRGQAPGRHPPRQRPNYNREGHWRDIRDELGVPNYEAAHLWGPGFGDEAAAGMMLAPPEVNQVWQSQGAERFLRELGAEARAAGGEVRVTATATSHGSDVRGGDALLAEVNYRFSVVDGAGNMVDAKHVSVSVDPPPSGRVHGVEVRDIPPPPRR